MHKLFTITLLCFGAIILTGCTTMMTANQKSPQQNPALLEPQAIARFNDIPVPVGFKLIPLESYSFETQGVRVGMLRYQGKANADAVANFYKEQMQIYNWNLLNVIEYGQSILNFDRGNETCIIALLAKGGKVIVNISLGPKSQMAKRVEKPVK